MGRLKKSIHIYRWGDFRLFRKKNNSKKTSLACKFICNSQPSCVRILPVGRLGQAVPQGPGLMMTSAAPPRWAKCRSRPLSSACCFVGRPGASERREKGSWRKNERNLEEIQFSNVNP